MIVCRAAELLLHYTTVGLQEGCKLNPAEVYRLTTCASMALGPALEAAQQAYKLAIAAAATIDATAGAAASELQFQENGIAAKALATLCCSIFKVAGEAALVVQHLERRDPTAALLATVCQPGKASTLCNRSAPILLWCAQQKGGLTQRQLAPLRYRAIQASYGVPVVVV